MLLIRAAYLTDEDSHPTEFWRPSSNEWWPELYTQIWDGDEWVGG